MNKLIKFSFLTVFAILAFSACGPKYSYETVEGDPMQARIYTLDNGLTVYMAPNHETPRIQTYIAVRTGGKNDPSETTGLSHYLEHLMFKGTEQFGTQDYEKEKPLLDAIEAQFEVYRKTTDEAARTAIYKVIDSLSYEASKLAIPNEYDKLMAAIGSSGTNAYTSMDATVYIEDIPSNQIDNWAKIQSDRFQNMVIRGFHTELETVYEEKNMSLTSDSEKVWEALYATLFPNHPYGKQSVLGTQEHLKNPSIINIKNHFANFYVPNNMAVCLSGDFDPDAMIVVIDKYFGNMKPNAKLAPPSTAAQPKISGPVVKEVVGLEAENLSLAWQAVGASAADADALSLMGSILYNGRAGIIDLELIQKQKVLSGSASPDLMADHGALVMRGRPKAGQKLEEVKDLLLGAVAKLKAGDFDEALLEAALNNYKVNMMTSLDRNSGRASMFVSVFTNRIAWADAVQRLDRISKLSKTDIVALANKLLGDDNYVLVYKRRGKDPNELKISKPEITAIETNRDVSSQFLRNIQAADVRPIEPVFVDYDKDLSKLTAKANIPVLYVKNPTTDLFQLDYVFELGSNNDPANGTAFDYLSYLGTSTMSPEQIKLEFYKIACSFRVSSSTNRSQISISGLSENMGQAMQLLESLIHDAQPNKEALENMKADILKRRADAKLNQSSNFSMLQNYAMYGPKSPATNILSAAQLKALTPKDLIDRIQKLAGVQHRVLYFGPLSEDEALAAVNRYHEVPQTLAPAPAPVIFPYLETPSNKVYLAEYDAKQIYFVQYSNYGERYQVENDLGVALYNAYFGGGMNGIVFQEMREARGLAYTARASLSQPSKLYDPYYFTAFIATQNDKMGIAMDAFAEIINDMPESENAFQLAKESQLARIQTQRIVKSGILSSYLSAEDMGINYDRRKAIYEKLGSMSLADVKAFQEKWVKNRTYTYCVLGDSKDLDLKKLGTFGPITRLTKEQIFGY
jgi:Predicted Zn-dependent peptidases